MAAGKTTFIKAICRQPGVDDAGEQPYLRHCERIRKQPQGNAFTILIFTGLTDEQEALDMGALEYFDSGNMCLIEWPSQIPNLLPDHICYRNH